MNASPVYYHSNIHSVHSQRNICEGQLPCDSQKLILAKTELIYTVQQIQTILHWLIKHCQLLPRIQGDLANINSVTDTRILGTTRTCSGSTANCVKFLFCAVMVSKYNDCQEVRRLICPAENFLNMSMIELCQLLRKYALCRSPKSYRKVYRSVFNANESYKWQ